MTIDWIVVATIAAPLLAAILGFWINQRFENRPKLVAYYGHVSEFEIRPQGVDQQLFKIHTHAIVVRNIGRRSAKNVRIGHYILPANFKVLPIIAHSVNDVLPGGGQEIVIPNLVPKRQITISYLYYPPLTWNQINAYVESDEGAAKILEVLPTPQMPKWLQRILWFLILVGTTTIIYLIYIGIKYFIK
jgi:hypothetical protein